jgi:hypothetical protein
MALSTTAQNEHHAKCRNLGIMLIYHFAGFIMLSENPARIGHIYQPETTKNGPAYYIPPPLSLVKK